METIGKLALTVIDGGMASAEHSEKSLIAKPPIRLPDTVDEAKALKAWADAQDDRQPSANILQITKHLQFLSATLPSKALDEETGKMRVAVYSKILGDFSNEALAYMARRACTELDWFPSPRQCLDMLRDYRPPATEKQQALQLCHSFWQGRFEDFILALQHDCAEQSLIDGVPARWKRIAVERGYLRYLSDTDSYVVRRPMRSVEEVADLDAVAPAARAQ